MKVNIRGKEFGKMVIFKNNSFEFSTNKINFIVGDNGRGKTTLLNIMFGLDKEFDGEVILPSDSSTVAYIPQDNSLYEKYTVKETLDLSVRYEKKYDINHELLKDIKMDQFINGLSGGQKQRVSIFRALLQKPSYILFDEPTASLDMTSINKFITIVNDLIREGVTVVIITHDQNFINNFNDCHVVDLNEVEYE